MENEISEGRVDENHGSGGHKVIILLTDWMEEFSQDILREYSPRMTDGIGNFSVSLRHCLRIYEWTTFAVDE